MAECAKGVYRPRRPRETAFYRLVEEHYERFEIDPIGWAQAEFGFDISDRMAEEFDDGR